MTLQVVRGNVTFGSMKTVAHSLHALMKQLLCDIADICQQQKKEKNRSILHQKEKIELHKKNKSEKLEILN